MITEVGILLLKIFLLLSSMTIILHKGLDLLESKFNAHAYIEIIYSFFIVFFGVYIFFIILF